jgi:FMN-dependent NADH-azoreductase
MYRLLHIDSSILGEASASRAVSRAFVAAWSAAHPDTAVTSRDLAASPLPHVTADLVTGLATEPDRRTPAQAAAVALSDTLIAEAEAADVIVIGAPMYNFSIPSTLKAWVDHVVRVQRTVRYTPEGQVEGLLTGKRVFVVASRGGIYSEGPRQAFDFQEPYLRTILGFVGLTDMTFIRVEGLGMGPEAASEGLARAHRTVAELVAPRRPAAA